jgi:hypothetical protein
MSNSAVGSEKDKTAPRDWTVDPETGRSNSSPAFLELAEFVGRLVKNQAKGLLEGRSPESAGILIMAQLAHVKNVGPLPDTDSALEEGEPTEQSQ